MPKLHFSWLLVLKNVYPFSTNFICPTSEGKHVLTVYKPSVRPSVCMNVYVYLNVYMWVAYISACFSSIRMIYIFIATQKPTYSPPFSPNQLWYLAKKILPTERMSRTSSQAENYSIISTIRHRLACGPLPIFMEPSLYIYMFNRAIYPCFFYCRV